ncbi:MAG: methyltransferase domain-containing protein, partial [Lachnospiraceae bacterium]|nr:methyltransferase domain-containing protein [Lachnospiraceae bacterium]
MEAYTDFAQVYDELMDDTPYEKWCEFLMELFQKSGADEGSKENDEGNDIYVINGKEIDDGEAAENLSQERNTILDLGCGTGTLTELLARRGYDMIGVDNAQEMLQIAMEKRERSGLPILYLLQDMREFELYGTVGTVVSVCDSLNYLLEEEDIVQTFRQVNNYLYPRGIFVFDFNTVYKYATVIGDATIAENREDCSFIWENYYHEEQEINEYDLTIFVSEERSPADGDSAQENTGDPMQGMLFRRFQEVHYQRGYRLEQMRSFLVKAGLDFVTAGDPDTPGEFPEESHRIYLVARKGP